MSRTYSFPSDGARRHKLMPAAIAAKLPRLGETDGQVYGEGPGPQVHLKLFSPLGRYTLYVLEFDGDDELFGYCLSPHGPAFDELGSASLAELSETWVYGMPAIERDQSWSATPLGECEGVELRADEDARGTACNRELREGTPRSAEGSQLRERDPEAEEASSR